MLGFISLSERGAADRLLADLAQRLMAAGQPVVAMVRADLPAARPCDMALRLWPSGAARRISQDLGPGADACTLDSGALQLAVGDTARAIAEAPPGAVVILNKFGKQEAAGRGTRELIGQGLAAGLRVLISVPPDTRAAFDAFTEGDATELAADPQVLERFLLTQA